MVSIRNFLKDHGWNSVALFFVIIVLVLAGYALWKDSTERSAEDAARFVAELRETEERQHNLRVQDTYGGETPQETLALYIEAVEEGDYELAAKYFVLEEQEREFRSFEGATTQDVERYITILKNAQNSIGQYYNDKKMFSIDKPIFIQMTVYPNGNWKIVKI